jgi:hypothetical protein
MTLQGSAHFAPITIVRVNKVGTYQEQYQVAAAEMLVDLRIEVRAGYDPSVMPTLNQAAPP